MLNPGISVSINHFRDLVVYRIDDNHFVALHEKSVRFQLRHFDVLLISAPLTRATYGLIGAAELRRMKDDATLVNLARGEIVQERPLYDHLVVSQAPALHRLHRCLVD